jgi:hypothetical protein
MNKYALIALHVVMTCTLFVMACADPVKGKLEGNWISKDGKTKLKITQKGFAMDHNAEIVEDYFVKDDTIFTSFEGNQPYTKFVIQSLEPNRLILVSPDTEPLEFIR